MMTDHYYNVADFTFRISIPEGQDIHHLLPSSFDPFYQGKANGGKDTLFSCAVQEEPLDEPEPEQVLEESENDMGYIQLSGGSGHYTVRLRHHGSTIHTMRADRMFRSARISLRWDDPQAAEALSALIHTIYSLAILFHDGVSIHAAAVAWGGKGYLFLGKSGTGKSTHAKLWTRYYPRCELLNDDNPTLRMREGQVMVYGTPWSGKTPCYKNLRYPLGGIARLYQAKANLFTPRSDADAFATLLPGCSAIRSDAAMRMRLYDTLERIVASGITIGTLECLPDEEAARLCASHLTEGRNKKK